MLEENAAYSKIRKGFKARSSLRFGFKLILTVGACLLLLLAELPVHWKIAGFITVGFVLLVSALLQRFLHSYFKIVKQSQQSDTKTKVSYVIHTCSSFKKEPSQLHDKNIKWKQIGYTLDALSEAKAALDKLTVEQQLSERPITEIKKRNRKPLFLEKLQEKGILLNVTPFDVFGLQMFNKLLVLLAVSAVIVKGMLVGLYKLNLSDLPSELTQTNLITGVVVLCLYGLIKLYMWKSVCYLRVIERQTTQGLHYEKTYHLQSYTTRKSSVEMLDENVAWSDYDIVVRNFNRYRANAREYVEKGRKSVLKVFKNDTEVITVTEESIA